MKTLLLLLLLCLLSLHAAVTAATVAFECAFDGGSLCGMVQETTDGEDWTVTDQATPSANTGPTTDYSGIGYYIFLEASDKEPDTTAVISTPPGALTPVCGAPFSLSLAVHMWGFHIGRLDVVEVVGGTEQTVHTRSKVGQNGENQWILLNDIEVSSAATKIQFKAVKGGNSASEPFSDIAIDEIRVEQDCPTTTTTTTTTTPTTTTTTPTTTTPTTTTTQTIEGEVIYGSDFQTGLDGFRQAMDDDVDLVWRFGSTDSQPTGPRVDHTYGNETGYYLYLEASQLAPGAAAVLYSPERRLNSSACLTFWYHMFGEHIGALTVTYKRDGEVTEAWSLAGNQGDAWRLGSATLPAGTADLAFRAVKGGSDVNHPYGDIALDDVFVYDGPCPTTAVPTTTTTTESTKAPAATADSLWGLDETSWIIILAVAGGLLLVLLIIVAVQACVLHKTKTKQMMISDDHDNFRDYSNKYDNPPANGGGANGGAGANGGGATSSTYIYAYDNGSFKGDGRI